MRQQGVVDDPLAGEPDEVHPARVRIATARPTYATPTANHSTTGRWIAASTSVDPPATNG